MFRFTASRLKFPLRQDQKDISLQIRHNERSDLSTECRPYFSPFN